MYRLLRFAKILIIGKSLGKSEKELPLDNFCAIKTAPGFIFLSRLGCGAPESI